MTSYKITTRATDKLRQRVIDAQKSLDVCGHSLRLSRQATLDDARKMLGAAHADMIRPAVEHLDAVNGRAASHTMTATDVIGIARDAESDLTGRGISIKNIIGTTVTHAPGGPGKAYARKGRYVTTTRVTLRRVADGWRMVSAEKIEVWADSKESTTYAVSLEARAEAIAHATRNMAP